MKSLRHPQVVAATVTGIFGLITLFATKSCGDKENSSDHRIRIEIATPQNLVENRSTPAPFIATPRATPAPRTQTTPEPVPAVEAEPQFRPADELQPSRLTAGCIATLHLVNKQTSKVLQPLPGVASFVDRADVFSLANHFVVPEFAKDRNGAMALRWDGYFDAPVEGAYVVTWNFKMGANTGGMRLGDEPVFDRSPRENMKTLYLAKGAHRVTVWLANDYPSLNHPRAVLTIGVRIPGDATPMVLAPRLLKSSPATPF